MKSRNTLFVALLGLGLWACGKTGTETPSNLEALTPAKGGKMSGGVIKINESEYIKTLFPPSIIDAYSYRTASQIYEGPLKFDQTTLALTNGIAESVETDASGLVFTIKLRKGVKFHNDECFSGGTGREVKASDLEFCIKQLCTPSATNKSFDLVDGIVVGANDFYNAAKSGSAPASVSGVKVVDDYTLEIKVLGSSEKFKFNLARPGFFVYPKEALDKYGEEMRIKCVGTGPFQIKNVEETRSIFLVRNPNYYLTDADGNQLPYLNGISIRFIDQKQVEYLEFQQKNLDVMYRVPADQIVKIIEESSKNSGPNGAPEFELQRAPQMTTQFMLFNNMGPVFKDKNLRKAFSFAIDRKRILDYALNGEGYKAGLNGVTPPSFPGQYNVDEIKGYDMNLDSAKFYLAKAGYPGGKGLPKITLWYNPDGSRHQNVALEMVKQLKENINVEIEPQMLPLTQITEKAQSGDYDLIRLAWTADYPNPESFLWFFYGKNMPQNPKDKWYPNMARYVNPKFDELYEKGISTVDIAEAFKMFMQAERVLMEDCPVLVVWYDEGYRLVQSYVKNFPCNAMEYRDFSTVYMTEKPKSANSEKEAAK